MRVCVQKSRQLPDQRLDVLHGRRPGAAQAVLEGRLQPVGCGHEHAVQFLSTMILAEPGQNLGGQQRDRVRQITDLMLFVAAQMLKRTSPGQQLQPRAESRVLRVHPRPSRDLGSGQADPIR